MIISAGFAALGALADLRFLLPEHIHSKLGLLLNRSKGGDIPSMEEKMFSSHNGDERGRPAVDHTEGNSHSAGT